MDLGFWQASLQIAGFYVNKISSRLVKLRSHIPSEFVRKSRQISECKRYKATEFRTFLLYTGPVVLKNILSIRHYTNFILLSVATSILLNNNLALDISWLDYAENLLTLFVSNSKNIYGCGFISHNIHNLLHLVECVKKFGDLDNFSAFPFENFMQQILRKIRKSDKPLQQVIRRIGNRTK
ncbi:hypothetical protein NQ314_002093 [Rhamnusium bicolor]|uniref:Uncharacterized protein n=1 Tax=Rhamnusium bicolor TaxID=1586634 RepID=A0AAV8ZS91_9CUCU|nr:hypothetical protein NQ314_002093 [Rhamnusium bicolor]